MDYRYIKITPEDLEEFKGAEASKRSSWNEVRAWKYKKILDQLKVLPHSAVASTKSLLYRFHTGSAGLLSPAQRHGEGPLLAEERGLFLSDHATRNIKTQTIGGREMHSPYVSTTSDLNALVDTTLSARGDTNLRQDVFDRADTISAFIVEQASCHKVSRASDSPSVLEAEICYDASETQLVSCCVRSISNPFKGQIEIDLAQFIRFRCQSVPDLKTKAAIEASGDAAKTASQAYTKLIPKATVAIEINDAFIKRYSTVYNAKEDCIRSVDEVARAVRGEPSLVPAVAAAAGGAGVPVDLAPGAAASGGGSGSGGGPLSAVTLPLALSAVSEGSERTTPSSTSSRDTANSIRRSFSTARSRSSTPPSPLVQNKEFPDRGVIE